MAASRGHPYTAGSVRNLLPRGVVVKAPRSRGAAIGVDIGGTKLLFALFDARFRVVDGKLHLGVSGDAGEIGHCLVSPLGPLSGSDRLGVLDDYVSRPALAGAAAAFAAKRWAPRLFELAGTDAGRIHNQTLAESIR